MARSNKEKLAQELHRLAAKRNAPGGAQQSQPVVDYVQDVDESALETLANGISKNWNFFNRNRNCKTSYWWNWRKRCNNEDNL